jgi:putative lipoprotein
VPFTACTKYKDHPPDVKKQSSIQQQEIATRTFVYECSGGYNFIARLEDQQVWLFLADQTIRLPQVPSGSGAKYSQGVITFWSKGEEAMLQTSSNTHRDCNNNRAKAIWEHAKLNGVDFRAVGNEPGWYLEIGGEGNIVYVGDYGKSRYEFFTPQPIVDQQNRTTTYTVSEQGHVLKIMIDGRPCRDTMSGEAFETTVHVTFDGKDYRGCGKALH